MQTFHLVSISYQISLCFEMYFYYCTVETVEKLRLKKKNYYYMYMSYM